MGDGFDYVGQDERFRFCAWLGIDPYRRRSQPLFDVCSSQLTDAVKDDHYSTYEYEDQNGWQDNESYSSLVLSIELEHCDVEVC